MPFKSDKQRRYLWSQKPEVAKKFAEHKQSGGGVYSSGIYDDAAKWHNARLAGVPQHVGFMDDPDNITEAVATNPDDPYGGRFVNPDRVQPKGKYTDLATYYTAKQRDMGRGEAELARMQIENERIKREAIERGFVNPDGSTNFQQGGEVPMADGRKPKKVTHKDRYGNQVSYEYQDEVKPLDINTLVEKVLGRQVPEMMEIPNVPVLGDVSIGFADAHPGEPRGSDTVPAWLTPGEFVVNAEAMSVPENAAAVEAINNQGRAMQQGGPIYRQEGGDTRDFWQRLKLLTGFEGDAPPPTATPQPVVQPMPEVSQENIPTSMPISPTQALLEAREGFREDVYLDSEGKPTVGHGHLLPSEYRDREGETPFSKQQLDEFFSEDMEVAREDAKANAKHYGVNFDELPRKVKTALTSQAFQLGQSGQRDFENMWKAIADNDYEKAAAEAIDSKWFEQTPKRARDLENALLGKGFWKGGPVYAQAGMDIPYGWNVEEGRPYTYEEGLAQGLVDTGGIVDDKYDFAGPETMFSDQIQQRMDAARGVTDAAAMFTDEAPSYEAEDVHRMPMPSGDSDDLGTAPTAVPPTAVPPMAMGIPDESSGEIPEGGGDFWSGIADWVTDTAVADKRNAEFNEKAAAANNEAAEETLAEFEQRVEDGQPVNLKTMDQVKAAVDHSQDQLEEAIIEKAKLETRTDIDYEDVVANEAKLMAQGLASTNEPGTEDDVVALDEAANDPQGSEEAAAITETGDEIVAQGEAKAQEDPGLVEKATGFFKGAFSDLFDEKELARMAIMYVGSRALGYSHHGSLSFAAKKYVSRVDAASAQKQKFATDNVGKFTASSLEAYKKSGDLSELVPIGPTPNSTGESKDFYIGGKRVRAEKYKVGDNYIWSHNGGKSAIPLTATDDPTKIPGTKEYNTRIKAETPILVDSFKEMQSRFGVASEDKTGKKTYRTDLTPTRVANQTAEWAAQNGVDVAQASRIMEQAYQLAISESGGEGKAKARSIVPYLNRMKLEQDTQLADLFDKADGQSIDAGKVEGLAQSAAARSGTEANPTFRNQFWSMAASKWNELDTDSKQGWEKEGRKAGTSGFFEYTRSQINS